MVKLLKVSGDHNNNKFYDMTEFPDGTFSAKWGRVGGSIASKNFPMTKWKSKYNEKIREGYQDITSLKVIPTSFKDISSTTVSHFLKQLQTYATTSVTQNYLVSADGVSQAQIDAAQVIIDQLVLIKDNTVSFNKKLEELFIIIPRKMGKVKDFLWDTGADNRNLIIDREQSALDAMSGQVSLSSDDSSETLLDAMDLTIEEVNKDDTSIILKSLNESSDYFKTAFRVVNHKTQKIFDEYHKTTKNKETKLFWHGSRNENWFNILRTGLLIRPANVTHTGNMYGYGIYFANKAKKSIGYTSLNGSYWARGLESTGYLALYEVHVGNKFEVSRHDSQYYTFNYDSLRRKGEYDSLYAKAGISIYNDEFVIYNTQQCTIKYIVELKK
ncbi:MAG TPA: hypothetical protein PKN48_00225 [Bacteroidales bacterium]|nr:hypothetical protein [Bacteroidales bacterium]